ncbi:phosphate ABC transporter membrane protein 1, PhoT family (TC 3.A.1.7.1) [Clostridium cavendishii DSM 21758]|uniref:Phosphate transport system permease protein n=1 Tax=Clostridium cavendishii DSM 21758 TaxID=1121302 RepID=A0A1M6KC47_9CLOT|nr:phosphate ABC transporter permease subunit PstC [Clostridium cavendishii]SHJ56528.1 phosphate ABC transporter membrane protein 1, PhoT family (TC 3.A.1.7.1) [Clostridium cavendishii DSM 21758]
MRKRSFWQKFKNEYIGKGFAYVCGMLIVSITLSIIFFIATKGINTFIKDGYSLSHFLTSTEWKPDDDNPSFGALVFISGSSFVSIGAVLLSTPIAIGLAIFMNMISPKLSKKILQPALELFVGIPSVVYGWIGVSVLVPLIKNNFGGLGFSLGAAMLVLSVMILPTIASIASDSIKSMPREYIEASYGLGATRWQTIYKVVIPSCKQGILTGVVLGLARAFGEALAVQMVIGNTFKMATSLNSSTSTLTSVITMDMANVPFGTAWNDALWSLAFILLIISFLFILLIRKIGNRGEA